MSFIAPVIIDYSATGNCQRNKFTAWNAMDDQKKKIENKFKTVMKHWMKSEREITQWPTIERARQKTNHEQLPQNFN